MTNDEKELQAEQEWEAVKHWAINEEDKVTARLKKDGIYYPGLDGESEKHYKYINEEVKRRLKDIQKRYFGKNEQDGKG